jgi:hypothetical protein
MQKAAITEGANCTEETGTLQKGLKKECIIEHYGILWIEEPSNL